MNKYLLNNDRKNLNSLLAYLAISTIAENKNIANITEDSRKVNIGDLFIALATDNIQVNNHIENAIIKNPSCIMVDSTMTVVKLVKNIPIIKVANLAIKLPQITNFFYDNPSQKIKLIGITGTNGKTSSSWFIADILQKLGSKCAMLGTLGQGFINNIQPTSHTTLAHTTLQQQLTSWGKQNIPYATLEVSSHGLIQNRVAGLSFDTVIFTNLTRDHLDYHKTINKYAQAKAKLFADYSYKTAIINLDSDYSSLMLNSCKKSANIITWSLVSCKTDIFAKIISVTSTGFKLQLHTPWGTHKCDIPLLGKFNIANILSAIAIISMQGYSLAEICEAIQHVSAPFGRTNMLTYASLPAIVIDYAHTPDAIENLLSSLQLHGYKNITCVFGCGGDRDKGKRKYMLQSAIKYATNVIITTDNPRTEPIDQIINDMLAGISKAEYQVISIIKDRKAAIKQAIYQTQQDGLVAVVGKGHESYQQIGNNRLKFNDLEEVKMICNNLRATRA